MTGKDKCKILKDIRQKIADENDIPYITEECGFKGSCKGTCPKCESELKYLEKELEKRRYLGKKVAVAGLAASMVVTLSGCVSDIWDDNVDLTGDVDLSQSSTYEEDGAIVEDIATFGDVPIEDCEVEVLEGDVAIETTDEYYEDAEGGLA